MMVNRVAIAAAWSVTLLTIAPLSIRGQEPGVARTYNTVKQKLAQGQQVVGATVTISSPEIYCTVANAGFDFTWIEMQHSPLTYQDVARTLIACKGAPAIPFIRVPDATEGDIQKATDIGALGIIVPMVDTVEKAQDAVKFAKYPPIGRRSQGGGQYGALWGDNYRHTANDNIMIVALIENPAGVEIADQIAAVPGIDVLFVASTDLGSFSGRRQGDPQYEALITRAREAARKAGRIVGGPLAWTNRDGFRFFQGPGEAALLRCGSRVSLGVKPTGCPNVGVAAIEGAEDR
ncbi:MAG: HpcH/HpaI aldolase family protein [Vicinamibacteraceae bacterium]